MLWAAVKGRFLCLKDIPTQGSNYNFKAVKFTFCIQKCAKQRGETQPVKHTSAFKIVIST